ncbi:hypothetical protein [Candidatus Finniella inopinata]|uniref:Uncharacterized protein n=1 Tax=Candidatus Finniella inopinata TaxID=1696036 RepID=A0A4Q7DL69_9PROT|nr:hypothetical protein [Candidatus Finniella inopinata]RZI45456.1 hypothetical protein EQU50_07145 [Candidatus Finniella inopinata]
MLDFIETAAAIKSYYTDLTDFLEEDDFWVLTAEQQKRLAKEDQDKEWFMINPSKLKDKTASISVVDSYEKDSLLRAVLFIMKTTNALPEGSSFKERLLYTKRVLPPVIFTDKGL